MSAKLPASLQPSPPSTSHFPFQFRGHDILDLLREARNYNRWLTNKIIAGKPLRAAKIADLGAGRGTLAEMLRARGLGISCVEPDPENQAVLRRLGFQVHSTMEEYELGSLDYVYTLNVLEHVNDDEALVRVAFSRLRRGGRIFIYVPAFPILWSTLDDHVEHRRRYRRGPMKAMLNRVGLTPEHIRYADCLGFFAAFIFGRSAATKISPRAIWLYDRLLFPVSRFLDPVLGYLFGKNLIAVCRKP
jgi:SAM-dependent methyltransferase